MTDTQTFFFYLSAELNSSKQPDYMKLQCPFVHGQVRDAFPRVNIVCFQVNTIKVDCTSVLLIKLKAKGQLLKAFHVMITQF